MGDLSLCRKSRRHVSINRMFSVKHNLEFVGLPIDSSTFGRLQVCLEELLE